MSWLGFNQVVIRPTMKIGLVIHAISMGGAERVLTIMANYWAAAGQTVQVICLDKERPPSFPLDPRVSRVYLGCKKPSPNLLTAMINNVRRLVLLRGAIRAARPAIIISYMDKVNVLTLISTVALPVPVLACEHTYPRGRSIGAIWEFLRNIFYCRAASVVALTESGLKCFSKPVQARGRVFPNPVTISSEFRGKALARTGEGGGKKAIALGRLIRVKGYDLLIAAFAPLAERYPEWSLEIWGEGEERGKLENQVERLGLAGRIRLPGATQNPFEKLCAADLFVLSSRTEGFPLGLCEAMACGLPVVSFDCQSGPSEIIHDGVNGVLVPAQNVAELTRAMDQLMGDATLRRQLAGRAPEVLDRFNAEKVMKSWDAFIAGLVK